VAHQERHWQTAYAVVSGERPPFVIVHLGQQELVLVLAGEPLQDRQQGVARCAPRDPEIDRHRLEWALQHGLIKIQFVSVEV
jgi:hypothetical protein